MRHDDHRGSERAAGALFTLLLALLSLPFAHAASLSVTAPLIVDEGTPVATSVSGPGTLAILIDNAQVATGTGTISYSLPTDSTSAGVRAYRFTTTDPGTPNETRSIVIRDVPLTLTVTSPAQTDLAVQSVTVSASVNWPAELCYATLDDLDTHALVPTGAMTFSTAIPVSDGVHALAVKCKLGDELPTVTRMLRVDTHAPSVASSGPNGMQSGTYTTLSIDTDEIALCRYGTSDAAYEDLPLSMGSTYATHNSVIVPLAASGPQTYFVRCADVLGNAMQLSRVISFGAQRPPAAMISVDGDEPLRAGSYKVSLRTDAPLVATPTLSATFASNGATQQIGLLPAGTSNDAWEGYLLIPQDQRDASVSFEFHGTGIEGTSGTQITDGGLITIDALPPSAVDAISIENTTNGILLSWFLKQPEDGLRYRIYRADHEGVEYTDELATSDDTTFADPAAGARYYWYRVAAVDRAGNLGPLSAEVYGSAIDPVIATGPLDATSQARIDETIIDLQATLATANATIATLEGEENPFKNRIIADLGLVERARNVRAELEQQLAELQQARVAAATVDDADAAISAAQEAMADARKQLVRRIVPDQEAETRQTLSDDDVSRNAPYAVAAHGQGLDRDALLRAAADARNSMTVTVSASSFSLWDWDNAEHPYTFVRKHVSLERPLNEVQLIETIPKEVAQDTDKMTFSTDPQVLERDPVVAWSFPVLQDESFTYLIDHKASLDDVKRTRTIAYPKPSAAPIVKDAAGPTGFALFDTGLPGSDMLLLAFGAIVIVALGAYYVTLGVQPTPFRGLARSDPEPILVGSRRNKPVRVPRTAFQEPHLARIISRPAPVPFSRARPAPPIATPAIPVPVDASGLLADAESAIDEKRYGAAVRSYGDALMMLERDADLAAAERQRALRVHAKLMLHRSLDAAGAALEHGDAVAAKRELAGAREAAMVVGQEPTTLIKEATLAYREFMRKLNRIEIDHASQY